jgi:hypothetical protein
VNIHILGVAKEADLVPLFQVRKKSYTRHFSIQENSQELNVINPVLHFTLHFFGPEISKSVHGKVYKRDRMKIVMRRKLYHTSSLTSEPPDFVIGIST